MATIQTKARKARQELQIAIQSYAIAQGEAQRLNGYRSGANDSDELRQKEMRKWATVTVAGQAVHRALRAYTRALRQAARS